MLGFAVLGMAVAAGVLADRPALSLTAHRTGSCTLVAGRPTTCSVAAPAPPRPYSLPRHASRVSNGLQLRRVLALRAPRDIVLADGVYDLPAGQHFVDWNGSRLYAQHLGGAVLHVALEIGGHGTASGTVVQGLAFDISDAKNSFQGGEITEWGRAGRHLHVLDCTFDGHWAVPIGLQALDPRGLVAQRLVFRHFTDQGLSESTNHQAPYGSPTEVASVISDISVDGVSRAVPGSSDGTAEAGLWIGQPVSGGVHRVRVRNVAISGIETCNNAFDTTFTDLDIDMSGPRAAVGVGVYLEHFSRHLVFDGFVIKGSEIGFTAEWDDGTAGNAAAHFTTIENGSIDAQGWSGERPSIGVELDVGTESTTVTGVVFRHQSFAAIDTYHTIGTNRFANNSFQLAAGVPHVATGHR